MIYWIFLLCLIVTIIVEGSFILLIFKRKDYLYYSVLCNLLTNPVLNLLLLTVGYFFDDTIYYVVLVIAEIVVVVVEALLYRILVDLQIKKAMLQQIHTTASNGSENQLQKEMRMKELKA